jgi:hypothetical protein
MSTESIADAVREYARDRKTRFPEVAEHLLIATRNDSLLAVLSGGDLNFLLGLADTVAAGYGADALALVIEGVLPTVEQNPLTGQAWQRGEAEALWREDDGVEKSWVAEAHITAIAFRGGATANEAWSFRVKDGRINWGDEPLRSSVSGLDTLLLARLSRPALDAARVPDPDIPGADPANGPFYPVDYGRVALDIGCTRSLGNQLGDRGDAILLVDSEERADYLIGEGLPRWQVETYAGTGV